MTPPLGLAPRDWDVFAPYGALHACVLAICAALIAASKNTELRLRWTLAALAVCYWLAYNIWWNWHGVDLRTGLPLQICDFNGLMAPPAALGASRRRAPPPASSHVAARS